MKFRDLLFWLAFLWGSLSYIAYVAYHSVDFTKWLIGTIIEIPIALASSIFMIWIYKQTREEKS